MKRRWFASLLAMIVLALFASSCGSDDGPEEAEPAEEPAASESDDESSSEASTDDGEELTLIVAATNSPGGFDGDALGANSQNVVVQINEPLVGYEIGERDDNGVAAIDPSAPVGRLAESWTISDDGLTYVFQLRQGVLSSYGNELTAADVEWSWAKSFHQERTGNFIARVGNVDSVEATGEYEVTFTLSNPSPIFLNALTLYVPGIYDSTEMQLHATDDDPYATEWLASNHAGFGAYAVESLTSEEAVFVRNENYYGDEPVFDRVVYRAVPDPTVRIQLLQSGDVDLIEEMPLASIDQLESADGVRVQAYTGTQHARILMRSDTPPFDDILVRQAVNMAIPYEQIAAEVFNGRGDVSRSPIAPPFPCYDPSHWDYETDTARAKELLTEAGYPDGIEVTLTYSDVDYWEEGVAIRAKSSLDEAGIRTTLSKVPAAVMATGIDEANLGFFTAGVESLIMDPGYSLFLTSHSDGVANDNGVSNADLDALVDEANSILDNERRCELLSEAQAVQVEDATWVQGWVADHHEAMSADIDGWVWWPDRHERWSDLAPVG